MSVFFHSEIAFNQSTETSSFAQFNPATDSSIGAKSSPVATSDDNPLLDQPTGTDVQPLFSHSHSPGLSVYLPPDQAHNLNVVKQPETSRRGIALNEYYKRFSHSHQNPLKDTKIFEYYCHLDNKYIQWY